MRLQGIIRDDSAQRESQSFIEPGGAIFGGGVEHQKRASARDRQAFGRAHQRPCHAAAAVTDPCHHFRDFGAMRLVRRQIEQQRHGADQLVCIEGPENDPLAAVGGGQRIPPERIGLLRRQRMHETDGAAAGDRFNQYFGQRRAGGGRSSVRGAIVISGIGQLRARATT